MSPERKDDESIQTSLRALMKQEEDRLEQLRLAKARIDRERAEAAREAEEERERKKAAAVERARVEALPPTIVEKVVHVIVPAPPRSSRFGAGFATGAAAALCAAAVGWIVLGAPRLAHAAKVSEALRAELDTEKAHGREARSASEAALGDRRKEIDVLRAENERLRREPETPKITPKSSVPPRRIAPTKPGCNPRDPLCGDL